jgi:hypothetical protein
MVVWGSQEYHGHHYTFCRSPASWTSCHHGWTCPDLSLGKGRDKITDTINEEVTGSYYKENISYYKKENSTPQLQNAR